MNDLTKEELENIIGLMHFYYTETSSDWNLDLYKKIQSMINKERPLHEQFADQENLSRG